MAVPRNTDFVTGTIVAALFLNRVQEMLAPLSINVELSISGTTVIMAAGAGDSAAVIAINGKLRYAEAAKSVEFSGQPSGTYGLWVSTTGDDNDASFTFSRSLSAPGGTYTRQIGTVDWSGSALSNLRQLVGYEKHGFMHSIEDPLPAASISKAMLNAQLAPHIVPTGTVLDYAGSSAPTGYLICDGSAISRSDYSDLFAIIGTTYGVGNGTSTFNIPEARGRAAIGAGTGPGLTARTLGAAVGAETVALVTGNMPSHNHGGLTGAEGGHAHNLPAYVGGMRFTPGAGNSQLSAGTAWSAGENIQVGGPVSSVGNHQHSIPSEGSGTAHANVQPSIVFNKIIKT